MLEAALMGSRALELGLAWCPDCETASIVRAAVIDREFARRVAIAVLPFAAMAIASGFIYRAPLRRFTSEPKDG
jgi:hypothetical protein